MKEPKQNKFFYKLITFFLRPLIKIFFPYEIVGAENINVLNQGYILCPNHLSNIDPIFFIVSHPKPIRFMAKAELFKNKILKWFFEDILGAFPVKRGKGDGKAILKAQQILNGGDVLGIFIEGTRSKTGEFLRPKSGAAVLAATSSVPVLPVCITGIAPDNKVHVFKKTIIKYGIPIMPQELNITGSSVVSRSELKSATNLIMDRIKELRN